MGPQGQKSSTTATHMPTQCRSDVIPASFQSARKRRWRRRWRRWRRRRKSGALLTPPGAGVNGTRISIMLDSIPHRKDVEGTRTCLPQPKSTTKIQLHRHLIRPNLSSRVSSQLHSNIIPASFKSVPRRRRRWKSAP